MVFPTQLMARFARPVPPYWFANINHLMSDKSGDVLHRFWKYWFRNYKRFFQVTMPKAISWFLLLMYEHEPAAFTIADTELKFDVIARGLCEPPNSDVALQQFVSEASTRAQNRTVLFFSLFAVL